MKDLLEWAKQVQKKTADETTVWINLALLEGLIAEIEELRHRVDVLSEQHPAVQLKAVRKNSTREQEDTAI